MGTCLGFYVVLGGLHLRSGAHDAVIITHMSETSRSSPSVHLPPAASVAMQRHLRIREHHLMMQHRVHAVAIGIADAHVAGWCLITMLPLADSGSSRSVCVTDRHLQ
jgi:hypothetical protein